MATPSAPAEHAHRRRVSASGAGDPSLAASKSLATMQASACH